MLASTDGTARAVGLVESVMRVMEKQRITIRFFPLKHGTQRQTIRRGTLPWFDMGRIQNCRGQIHADDRDVAGHGGSKRFPGGDLRGPADNKRHSQSTFIQITLARP